MRLLLLIDFFDPSIGGDSSKFDTGLESIHRRAWGKGLKTVLKNIYEGFHLSVKLPSINLQACKFTKNELYYTYLSRVLARI